VFGELGRTQHCTQYDVMEAIIQTWNRQVGAGRNVVDVAVVLVAVEDVHLAAASQVVDRVVRSTNRWKTGAQTVLGDVRLPADGGRDVRLIRLRCNDVNRLRHF